MVPGIHTSSKETRRDNGLGKSLRNTDLCIWFKRI